MATAGVWVPPPHPPQKLVYEKTENQGVQPKIFGARQVCSHQLYNVNAEGVCPHRQVVFSRRFGINKLVHIARKFTEAYTNICLPKPSSDLFSLAYVSADGVVVPSRLRQYAPTAPPKFPVSKRTNKIQRHPTQKIFF